MTERQWEVFAWQRNGPILFGSYERLIDAVRDAWTTFAAPDILAACVRRAGTREYQMWLDVQYFHPEKGRPTAQADDDDENAADRWEGKR